MGRVSEDDRRKLYEAIGLSQAQFANPDGDGLDSAALIAAIDEYTEAVTADARALLRDAAEGVDAALVDLKALAGKLYDDHPNLNAAIYNLIHVRARIEGGASS